MEVLSWKIMEEEPSACSLISQALNKSHQVDLNTTELTALAVLSSAITTEMESAVAAKLELESIREKVRHELDLCVDEPEFIELFEFVLNLWW